MSISFPLGEVNLIQDHIVCVTLFKDGEVDETMVVQLIKATITLSAGQPYSILIDFNNKSVPSTHLAKQLVAVRSEHESRVTARAITGLSEISSKDTTDFLEHYKPLVPTRVFETRDLALAWLTDFSRKQRPKRYAK